MLSQEFSDMTIHIGLSRSPLGWAPAMYVLTAWAAFAAGPAIQGVVNAANHQPAFASATWVTISGTDLAASTTNWSDFTNGNLPTSLDGVTVTINGRPAYVAFVSPNQINALAPDDPATGMVPVLVTNSLGTSNTFQANKQTTAPALFEHSQSGGSYAVAQAAPGENLTLYGTGFGPVTPEQPTGKIVQNAVPTANPVTVMIGGARATVRFAGLIGAGIYQINVAVPPVLSGDAAIAVSVAGTAAATQPRVPIQTAPEAIVGPTAPALIGCLMGQVDYITYSLGLITFGRPDEASIGGTQLCSTCTVKPPIYPEFARKMEQALVRKETVQACYDKDGVVYQMKVMKP